MALPATYAPLASVLKDPDATADYTIDWSAWLGADTISGAPVWVADTGLTVASSSNTSTTATARVTGGTEFQTYKLRCRITTTAGLIEDRTIEVTVVSR